MGFDLDHLFTRHPTTEDTAPKHEAIRVAAREFAEAIVDNSPPGYDQDNAIQKVREAVRAASASIALGGKVLCDDKPEPEAQ